MSQISCPAVVFGLRDSNVQGIPPPLWSAPAFRPASCGRGLPNAVEFADEPSRQLSSDIGLPLLIRHDGDTVVGSGAAVELLQESQDVFREGTWVCCEDLL